MGEGDNNRIHHADESVGRERGRHGRSDTDVHAISLQEIWSDMAF